MKKAPPIGIEPKQVWENQRLLSLRGAIQRYLEAGLRIEPKWIEEYNELSTKYVEQSKKFIL
jgi:hypothetical protein